jgi:hypothetical protein
LNKRNTKDYVVVWVHVAVVVGVHGLMGESANHKERFVEMTPEQ